MTQVDFYQVLPEIYQRLTKGGIFLTAGKDAPNTMTIGWGSVGMYWGKPTFVVPVRFSRHTHGLMGDCFTVSVPAEGTMKQELLLCGTKSGRDMDKWEAAGLTARPASQVDTAIVDGCALYLECRIRMVQDMAPGVLSEADDARWYGDKDYHTMYYGEVVACYRP